MTDKKKTKLIANLDKYESDLEANLAKAKPLSKKEKISHIDTLKQAAQNYTKKDKRISIRICGSDLENIKRIAMQEALPYQTLITSVLHKSAT